MLGVVAHAEKTVGGGLEELRAALADAGHADPPWVEVNRSRKAPKAVRRLLDEGIDVLVVWGGDGMVQRSIDALLGSGWADRVAVAVIPAGTANLLANSMSIPIDVRGAVDVALHGRRLALDVGRINGEHFTVMAGTGFDALMMREADRGLKDRIGRFAYVWKGWQNLGNSSAEAAITVDGSLWYEGRTSCVLLANVGTLVGGIEAFPAADPSDGLLEVGVVRAESRGEWARVLVRATVGRAEDSPLVDVTRGRKVDITLDRTLPWELDGGDRERASSFKVRVKQGAVSLCVPNNPSSR